MMPSSLCGDFIIFSRALLRSISTLAALASLSACSSLLYAPNNFLYADPHQVEMNYEEVVFTSGKSRLHGWYFTQTAYPQPRGQILFFHGNGQNRSSHFLALKWVLEKGYDYFIFDYQGYGDSEGTPTPEHTVQDGLMAMKYLHERNPRLPLAIFAQSLGGAVALRTLVEFEQHNKSLPPELKLLILDSTFLSYQRAAAGILSAHAISFLFQPFALLVPDSFSPAAVDSRLPRVPALVIHGTNDQMIAESLGKEVYDSLPGPKCFMEVKEGRHISSMFEADSRYRDSVWIKLDQYLVPPVPFSTASLPVLKSSELTFSELPLKCEE